MSHVWRTFATSAALVMVSATAGTGAPLRTPDRPRVAAFLWHESPNDRAALAGFQAGLRTAGLDWDVRLHAADGDPERAATALAAIRANAPDLVLALGTRAARLVRDGVPDTPIVFTAVTNPVETGIAQAWTGSGDRLAGNSNWLPASELVAAFRAAVPSLRTLGVVRDPQNPVSRAEVLEMVQALRASEPRIRVRVADVLRAESLPAALADLHAAGIDALWVPIDHLIYRHMGTVRAVCDGARIPILTTAAAARDDAVLAVVPDYHLLGLQAAELARRVLVEGATPGALPVGRLRSFRTVVNLAAAARCGHTLPLPALASADEVIR